MRRESAISGCACISRHGRQFDGFAPATAAQINPSYLWLASGVEPKGSLELSIDASGDTVRLFSTPPPTPTSACKTPLA